MKDSTKEKRSSDDASHVGLGSSWRFQMPQGNRKEPPTVTLMLLMLAMRARRGGGGSGGTRILRLKLKQFVSCRQCRRVPPDPIQ